MIKTSRQVVLCLLDLSEPQQDHPVSSQSTRRWEIRSQEDRGTSRKSKDNQQKDCRAETNAGRESRDADSPAIRVERPL